MNPLLVRRGLLVLAGVVVLAVAASLRRGATPLPSPSTSAMPPLSGTSGEGLVYRRIIDGKERGVVKAKAFAGQEKEGTRLKEVEATFDHVHEGEPGKTTIVADDCLYDAEKQKAAFHGNVKVTTTEGLDLESASLVYNGAKELGRSEEAVEFRRGALSGRSTGMSYDAGGGLLGLDREVFLRIEHDEGPATEIRSGTANASRSEAIMRFDGGVEVTRGSESLKARKLNVNLSPDLSFVVRAVAIDDMELRAAAGTPGSAGAGEKPRVIKGRKLDAWFHEDTHKLREAMAGPDASLELPSAAEEDRALTARFINTIFDPAGRILEIQGLRDAVLVSKARGKGETGGRTVRCFTLIGRTDPASGEVVNMDFQGPVEIVEPKRRATAESGHYEEKGQVLSLAGRARLVDEAQGSDLTADGITAEGKSGNVSAHGNVRHLVTPKAKGGPLGESRVWQIMSRSFEYDAEKKIGTYRDNALLRAGEDEIRAPVIVIDEAKPGQRRLAARDGVRSILHARDDKKDTSAKAKRKPIETESAEMLYEEAKGTVVYRTDVTIRQGDVVTRSPEATAFLNADGSRIERVVAGEPVSVEQGQKRASGTRGTYTLDDETMLLVGDKVVLEDPKGHVQGRSLTFHSGDDTILVDGREVERTESVFRREPKKP